MSESDSEENSFLGEIFQKLLLFNSETESASVIKKNWKVSETTGLQFREPESRKGLHRTKHLLKKALLG